ncbi:hypothetical protein V6N11_003280 [Hibiscus sabdariffa]|uniref:Uncharacterized protein n=1 Tax=Hibiscus sabdariffa TaxID=183260 RepID=A0ABR2SDM7_9ROSI
MAAQTSKLIPSRLNRRVRPLQVRIMGKSMNSNVNKRMFSSGLSPLMTDHVGGFEPCFVAGNPAEERKEFSLQVVCNSCDEMGREELLSLGVRLEEGRDLYIRCSSI